MGTATHKQASFQHRITGGAITLGGVTAVFLFLGFTVLNPEVTPHNTAIVFGGIFFAFTQILIGIGLFFNTTWGNMSGKLFYGMIFLISFLETLTVPGIVSAAVITGIMWGDPNDY